MAASAESAARPHFQLFSAGPGLPVRWRLLAANNRELGRSAELYVDPVAATRAIETLVDGFAALVPLVTRVAQGWHWAFMYETAPVVVCAAPLDRRGRAVLGHQRFAEAAPLGAVTSTLMVSSARRWDRAGSSTAPQVAVDITDSSRRLREAVGR